MVIFMPEIRLALGPIGKYQATDCLLIGTPASISAKWSNHIQSPLKKNPFWFGIFRNNANNKGNSFSLGNTRAWIYRALAKTTVAEFRDA